MEYSNMLRKGKILDAYSQKRQNSNSIFPEKATFLTGILRKFHIPYKDLEQQIEKRKKYSRRRTYNDDADVDFISESNCKFNKKLERFYGELTVEIKHNLGRGAAI
uniref:Pre-mRNA-splicing factor SYF2 n=1 Tax=Glossina austeni TaxID=7395 RepID=A0A1A9VPD9_GLOAU